MRAHRYAYEQAHGPIPEGFVILHECDNPSCINPEHLRAGTQADNLADMTDKGRRARVHGEEHHATSLTDDQVRAIRRAKHAPRKLLAKRYGISPGVVSDIRSRRTWAHVRDERR